MSGLKALSTAGVCEWLQSRGASQQDVECIRSKRLLTKIIFVCDNEPPMELGQYSSSSCRPNGE